MVGGDDKKSNLKLIALVVLVIPLAGLGYLGYRFYRRWRYHGTAMNLRLSGERMPGEVDDYEMGQALGEANWLAQRATAGNDPRTTTVPMGGAAGGGGGIAPEEFDPIRKQAEANQRRRARRHRASLGDRDGRDPDEEDEDDEDDEDQNMFSPAEGHDDALDRRGSGGRPAVPTVKDTIYATSMAPQQAPLRASDVVLGDVTATTNIAAAATSGADNVGGVPGMLLRSSSASPTLPGEGNRFDTAAYNTTAKVLLDKYTDPTLAPTSPADTGAMKGSPFAATAAHGVGKASPGLLSSPRPGGVGSGGGGTVGMMTSLATPPQTAGAATSAAHRRQDSATFENILASVAAPVAVGADFHQKVGGGGGAAVPSASTVATREGSAPATVPAAAAAAAATAHAEDDGSVEYEEVEETEEEEETDEEEETEEEEEDDVR